LSLEHLIEDANELQEIIDTLTIDKVIDDDEETDPNFKLPKWLRDEFKVIYYHRSTIKTLHYYYLGSHRKYYCSNISSS